MRYNIFRNDDISVTTDWRLLVETHRIITEAGKTHVAAVLMDGLWDNKEVWFCLMTLPGLKIGLHGWRRCHDDYSQKPLPLIVSEFTTAIEYYREHTGHYPNAPKIDTFFPPWNRVSDELRTACELCDLKLDARWKHGTEVYGFHSWELAGPHGPRRRKRLLKALKT